MPTTSETINYDSFLTLTIKNYSDKLEKNFLKWRPIVSLLFDNWSKTDTRGGRIWQGIAEYGQNPTTKFFDGADTFDQTPAQVAQPIQFQWRYIGAAVSMTKTEMLENSGPVALADLAETRMKQAVRTAVLVLGQECFGDGTNYGGKTIVGLAAAVSTTPTSGSVGGLDPAVWTWWRNNYQSVGSFAANGVNGASNDYFLRHYNNCTDGMIERPTAIVSDQLSWEYYNKTNYQPVRYILPDTKTADLSFQALEYQGMPWYWDRQCPSGRAYILNNNYIHFKVDPRFKFEWTAPLTYPNQLAFTRILGLRLVLVTTNRMFHAVLDNIAA